VIVNGAANKRLQRTALCAAADAEALGRQRAIAMRWSRRSERR
jgi:hypothetical protein